MAKVKLTGIPEKSKYESLWKQYKNKGFLNDFNRSELSINKISKDIENLKPGSVECFNNKYPLNKWLNVWINVGTENNTKQDLAGDTSHLTTPKI